MKFDWEDKMEIKIAYYQDMWQQIKDNALFTIHKNNYLFWEILTNFVK